jgi:hypothetical protein
MINILDFDKEKIKKCQGLAIAVPFAKERVKIENTKT